MQLSLSQLVDASSVAASVNYAITGAHLMQPREIAAVWTATTVSGSIKVQISLDNTNWFDLETATSITNASGSKLWTMDRYAPYVRVNYTRSSGTLTTLQIQVSSVPYS